MKTAVVYCSRHHGNTKKVLDAIAQGRDVTLIDAAEAPQADLTGYDLIGFASGIYGGRFHKSVLEAAKNSLPQGKKVFFLCTYGGGENVSSIAKAVREKDAQVVGKFGCKGYDTFGPFKLVGGIAKGRPNQADLDSACRFFDELCRKLEP